MLHAITQHVIDIRHATEILHFRSRQVEGRVACQVDIHLNIRHRAASDDRRVDIHHRNRLSASVRHIVILVISPPGNPVGTAGQIIGDVIHAIHVSARSIQPEQVAQLSIRCAHIMEGTCRDRQFKERVAILRLQHNRRERVAILLRSRDIIQHNSREAGVFHRLLVGCLIDEEPLQIVRGPVIKHGRIRQRHVLGFASLLVIEGWGDDLLSPARALDALEVRRIFARQGNLHLVPRHLFTDIKHQIRVSRTMFREARLERDVIIDGALGRLVLTSIDRIPMDGSPTQMERGIERSRIRELLPIVKLVRYGDVRTTCQHLRRRDIDERVASRRDGVREGGRTSEHRLHIVIQDIIISPTGGLSAIGESVDVRDGALTVLLARLPIEHLRNRRGHRFSAIVVRSRHLTRGQCGGIRDTGDFLRGRQAIRFYFRSTFFDRIDELPILCVISAVLVGIRVGNRSLTRRKFRREDRWRRHGERSSAVIRHGRWSRSRDLRCAMDSRSAIRGERELREDNMVGECPNMPIPCAILIYIFIIHIPLTGRFRANQRIYRLEHISACILHLRQSRRNDLRRTTYRRFPISRHVEVRLPDINVLLKVAGHTALVRDCVGTHHQDRASTIRGGIRTGDGQVGIRSAVIADIHAQRFESDDGSSGSRYIDIRNRTALHCDIRQ